MDNGIMVGEAVAGEAAKTRKQLEHIITQVNKSAFDIGDLLWKIKSNGYYEGFTTFLEFTKSLKLKDSKARYYTRIAEVMTTLGIPREKYEPLGTAKLRAITSLEMGTNWTNPQTGIETPINTFIQGFVEQGGDMTLAEVHQHVNTIKGKVGENAMSWLHLYMKTQAIEQTARPALELAKAMIGSVSKDSEGISQDASDGSAAESVFASFLADPANAVLAGTLTNETFTDEANEESYVNEDIQVGS
jgi:hypothetical protein